MPGRISIANLLFRAALTVAAGSPFVLGPTDSRPPATPRTTATDTATKATVDQARRSGTELLDEYRGVRWNSNDSIGHPAQVFIKHAMLAVLPDPLDSHQDWAFDSELESFRRAFEKAGFVLDRYWLPWTPTADGTRQGATTGGDSSRARWPGVMLFRHQAGPDSVALLYLVGEIPTRGINATAFGNALCDRASALRSVAADWTEWPSTPDLPRKRLPAAPSKPQTKPQPKAPPKPELAPQTIPIRCDVDDPMFQRLKVVGPTFSGSASSLHRALAAAHAAGWIAGADIVTGGATVVKIDSVLRDASTTFSSTVNSSELLVQRVQDALTRGLGLRPRDIAYLSESGTQFGVQLGTRFSSQDSALRIPFPMNISRLRTEYIRDVLPSDTIGRPNAMRTRIDWRDPASATESPAALSDWTAPMIERTIDDIEQTLSLHQIKAVGILATDIRDRLFLASVVKERLRDVKVFFISSNTLYLRPELNDDLRGSLIVSTYPLFLENQFWDLAHIERDRIAFTSDISEGTYNATLMQLGAGAQATDYAFPLQRDTSVVPPVWITTVGARSLLPVVADTHTTERSKAYVHPRSSTASRARAETGRPELMTILAIAIVGLFCLVVCWQFDDWKKRVWTHVPAAEPWVDTQRKLVMHRQSWATFRFVLVVCGFVPIALVLFRGQAHGAVPSQIAFWTLLVGLPVAMALTVALILRLPAFEKFTVTGAMRTGVQRLRQDTRHASILLLAAAYGIATVAFVVQIGWLPPEKAAPFFMRALAWTSGVTPLLPLAVGALLLIVWSTWHLTRLSYLAELTAFEAACTEKRPDAPHAGCECDRGLPESLREHVTGIADSLLRSHVNDAWWIVLGGLAVPFVWLLTQFDGSLETIVLGPLVDCPRIPSAFDFLFRFLVLGSLSLIVWTLYRLVAVAIRFATLLRSIEGLPIAEAFARLPTPISTLARFTPFGAPSPEAVDIVVDRAIMVRWRTLASLHPPGILHAAIGRWSGGACEEIRSKHNTFDTTIARSVTELYTALRGEAGRDARLLAVDEGKKEKDATGQAAGDATGQATRDAMSKEWPFVAQELFALYVIDYVEWVVRHLRHLAFSLTMSLVFTTILLSSYPFEPANLVKVFLFALIIASVGFVGGLVFFMSRDVTLSRISNTAPGAVTWDVRLLINVALVAGVPLLTLLGSEFPQVRGVLFAWVTPLLRAFGRA